MTKVTPTNNKPEPTEASEEQVVSETVTKNEAGQQVIRRVVRRTAQNESTSGTTIIFQVLSYIGWALVISGLPWLFDTVVRFFVFSSSEYVSVIPHVAATALVLVPAAFLLDMFYRKREQLHKSGGELALSIVALVLTGLAGLPSLIYAFTQFFYFILGTGDQTGTEYLVRSGTGLFTVLILAGFFLRTLNRKKATRLPKLYSLTMLTVSVVLVLTAVISPITNRQQRIDDRLIEVGNQEVIHAIKSYARSNGKLPASLKDIDNRDKMSSEARQLLDQNLLEYKPITTDNPSPSSTSSSSQYATLSFEVCATFNTKNKPYFSYSSSSNNLKSHDAGRTCTRDEIWTHVKTPKKPATTPQTQDNTGDAS